MVLLLLTILQFWDIILSNESVFGGGYESDVIQNNYENIISICTVHD